MLVHAHPDDETIGTGGAMARAVADGHRVVLVTCTRGELGEIVVPELDTPANHRRLGEIRAAELEAAMDALGVTEWENLGYRDSGMMGQPGNHDPRSFWQADRDEAIGRLVWMVRRYRPDVITGYNAFGGYGHPDHVNAHRVAVGAFYRAGDPEWYPEQIAPEHGGTGPAEADGGLAPWAPAKLYEQAMGRARREAMAARMEAAGVRLSGHALTRRTRRPWRPGAFMRRSTVDDEEITTRVDCARFTRNAGRPSWPTGRKLSAESPLLAMGPRRDGGGHGDETLHPARAARVTTHFPEADLFEGLD